MSSRLLTMKFMQRAAASSPASSPSTPDTPSPKRRKTDASPVSAFDVNELANRRAVEAALATEEAIRQAALDRQAADAGDTRWVLNFEQTQSPSPNQERHKIRVIQTGFATLDQAPLERAIISDEEDENTSSPMVGRRSFGKFNRTIEVSRLQFRESIRLLTMIQRLQDPNADDSSSSDEDGDDNEDGDEDEDSDDPFSTNALLKEVKNEAGKKLKEERKAKRKAEKAELLRLAEKRKKKDVKLNNLTSISGGSTQTSQACHRCGQVGHLMAECPKRGRGREDPGDRSQRSRKSR
jgi:hypothetical protein